MVKKQSKKLRFHRLFRRVYIWRISSILLFALLIISLFSGGFKDFFVGVQTDLGSKKVSEKSINFINENLLQGQGVAILKGVSDKGSVYEITLGIGGLEYKSYVTKDGKLLFPQGIDMVEAQEIMAASQTTGSAVVECSEDVSKNDKPVVQAFVMSHCPYGTQIEKGLLPVLKLLKNKIDFKLRFVYYAMHGETEVKEELRQYCIQKEQNDKFLEYLECFLEDGNSENCLDESGIDSKKLASCEQSADKEFSIMDNLADNSKWLNGRYPLFNVDSALNTKYGIGGSPSLIINDAEVSSARDPASLLSTICCAFNNKPSECGEALTSATPSPGFGTSTTNSNTQAGCGS